MNKPIGIFDSGVGGLSIFSPIRKLLPNENIIYLADSINAPYGNKSIEDIIQLSIKNCKKLVEFDCKLIVVACNTASTLAVETLREQFSHIPIVALEPAIKPALQYSTKNIIGVLATKGTLSSPLFYKTSLTNNNGKKIVKIPADDLVYMAENAQSDTNIIRSSLFKYIQPMIDQGIDSLVLGCTHYPLFKSHIAYLYPDLQVFDSGDAIANRVHYLLEQNQLISNNSSGKTSFFTNNDSLKLKNVLEKIVNHPITDHISIQKLDF